MANIEKVVSRNFKLSDFSDVIFLAGYFGCGSLVEQLLLKVKADSRWKSEAPSAEHISNLWLGAHYGALEQRRFSKRGFLELSRSLAIWSLKKQMNWNHWTRVLNAVAHCLQGIVVEPP